MARRAGFPTDGLSHLAAITSPVTWFFRKPSAPDQAPRSLWGSRAPGQPGHAQPRTAIPCLPG